MKEKMKEKKREVYLCSCCFFVYLCCILVLLDCVDYIGFCCVCLIL